jgi:hypothetical protein
LPDHLYLSNKTSEGSLLVHDQSLDRALLVYNILN